MKDGIYRDLSNQEYHENGTHVSSTGLRHARKSLKEFWYFKNGHIRKDSYALDFGNAFEMALIDPESFEKEVAIVQDSYWVAKALEAKPDLSKPRASKVYSDYRKKFDERNEGRLKIMDKGSHSFELIETMLDSCYRDALIKKLIKDTEYQVSMFWTDHNGLKCKTRTDLTKKQIIIDIKTTDDGSPEGFSKSLAKYDYPFQACMQIDGCTSSGLMKEVKNYFWLVVEKTIPFSATIYEFGESDIRYCMDEYRYIKSNVAAAIKTKKFPSYSQRADNKFGVLTAQIPLWYKTI